MVEVATSMPLRLRELVELLHVLVELVEWLVELVAWLGERTQI